MKFEDAIKLEYGDGIIIDDNIGTVTNIKEMKSAREIEITIINKYNGNTEKIFPKIYTKHPNEIHNKVILKRMKKWEPFIL